MIVYHVSLSDLRYIAAKIGVRLYEENEVKNKKGEIKYVSFKLRLINEKYRKYNHKFGKDRKSYGVCWHGHRDFMKIMFEKFPDAKLISRPLYLKDKVVYNGKNDFYHKYTDTDDTYIFTNFLGTAYSFCKCE